VCLRFIQMIVNLLSGVSYIYFKREGNLLCKVFMTVCICHLTMQSKFSISGVDHNWHNLLQPDL
jgi:hypothetical protein